NNTYDLKLANNLTIGEKGDGTPGKPGEDGEIKVIDKNGKDGVTIGAKDGEGTIGINGKDGKDAQITVAKGKDTLDNKEPGRIIYKTTNNEGDEITLQVATMEDGLKFEGNYRDGTNEPIAKKLNEQLNIEGTHTAGKDALTKGNIGVINNGEKLVVELAKDVNLTEAGSIYFGKDGAKISNDNGDIKVGDENGGPVKITNLAPGEADTDAVNVSQLKEAAEGNRTYLTVNGGTEAPKTPGQYTDGNLKLTHGGEDNNTYDLKLANNLTIGEKGENGKPGEDGQIKVIDKDGNPGVTVAAKDGNGTIGLNGKNGNDAVKADITLEKGEPGVKETNEKTRIVYTTEDGKKETIATLNDGLKFGGNYLESTDKNISKKLGETLEVVGSHKAGKDQLTKGNIGVINDGEKLVIELAKAVDLTKDGNLTIGNTFVNNNGLTINNTDPDKIIKLTDNNVSMGGN
ncbi:hypothetical protein OFN68_08070, partial [Campylobacter sp. JMF_07 ED4]|uniref:hypothetical protein n=1 Tax=Campylobacter sp. JMF_07 ED4 TaxID=2983840 RepID=UPI0022E9BBB1